MIYADPILVLVTWWTSLVGLWIFFILFSQIELIARETTTYEVQKRKNVGVDPCTSRALRSLWLFFTTGMYSISYPSTAGASPGTGHSHQCTSGKCSHTAAGEGARHMDHYSYSALSKHEVWWASEQRWIQRVCMRGCAGTGAVPLRVSWVTSGILLHASMNSY